MVEFCLELGIGQSTVGDHDDVDVNTAAAAPAFGDKGLDARETLNRIRHVGGFNLSQLATHRSNVTGELGLSKERRRYTHGFSFPEKPGFRTRGPLVP